MQDVVGFEMRELLAELFALFLFLVLLAVVFSGTLSKIWTWLEEEHKSEKRL